MGDEISRTAQQVRVPGSNTTHRMSRAYSTTAGRIYRTGCGEEFSNTLHRAVLTTTGASCGRCAPSRRKG